MSFSTARRSPTARPETPNPDGSDNSTVTGAVFWERIAVYVATLAVGSAFSVLFSTGGGEQAFGASSVVRLSGGGGFVALLGAAVAALAIASSGRYRFVLLLPGVIVYTLVAVYGLPPLTFSGWRELAQRVGADFFAAANTMYAQPIPYELAPGLMAVFIPMVMIICAFATSAALYERTPIISVGTLGLTLGVLSTISFEDGIGVYFFVFLISSLVLLLFSGVAGESGGLVRSGLVVGAVVAAVVLLLPRAPFSDETVSGGAIDWTRIGTGGPSRLDVQVDVGDYLTSGRDSELMIVSSSEPLLWRGGTLDYFDGVRWDNTSETGQPDGEEVSPYVESDPVVQTVEVLDAETDLMFGGYEVAGITGDFGNAVESEDGSWRATEELSEGDRYRVFSQVPQPTTEQLQGSGTDYPSEVGERFLQLPEDTPSVVGETADEIRQNYDVSTPYNTALAVERYLVSDGGFTYNLDVSYRRADWAIEDFLGDGREGFCTQFATSMALILRDMDIPTRVVYGATTGDQVDENLYLVEGRNMHTWVEVYFPGVGWYPFDPTPGFGIPNAMQANAPRPAVTGSDAVQTPQSENQALAENEQRQNEAETPAEQNAEQEVEQAQSGDEPAVWPFYLIAGVLVLLSIPASKRLLLGRGRPEDQYRDIVGRLRDLLPPGRSFIADSDTLTVNERIALLAGACGLDEEPFVAFARSYSDYLYAPASGRAGRREISRRYRLALAELGGLPLWRRGLAAVNPGSLVRRIGRGLAAAKVLLGKRARSSLGRVAKWVGNHRRGGGKN